MPISFSRKKLFAFTSILFLSLSIIGLGSPAQAVNIPDAGFEDGTLTNWSKGTQTGNLGATITGNGTGVTVFSGTRTFTHSSHGAVGSPTKSDGTPNPYYAPAVAAGSWTFGPNNATYAAALQPKGEQTFSQAMTALGLSGSPQTAIQAQLTADRNASGFGSPTPTDAAWITREVQLTAGTTYTMSWNYLGTDYVPFNDGSVTSLVAVNVASTPVITVNNFERTYAMLGFTNPGTGDYSTNSYGATGWQTSTYEVSVTGIYKLGFAVFNLGDTALSPVLMIDNAAGTTNKCAQDGSNCVSFGGVEANNETAPTVAPTTTTTSTTSTTVPASTTTTTTTTTTTVPAPTSIEVTNLLDDGSEGSLRWAITQANATAGGIYDSITFDVDGTITLISALPQVTQNLTVTGNGRTQTIIDGNNLYRPFNVASTKSLTVSNMTLKQGQATNGGLIFNGSGTVVATNIRFTGMTGGSAVFNNNNGSTATYTNCTFDYLNIGIAGDYGSTPQLATGVTTWANESDSVFTNKTYVINSVFTNNTYGINNYRFTKIQNSQFTNNSYGANVTGLNRTQILDSTFTSNGIGIYHNSWIPTTFNMGTDNRLITGNTFTNNSISMYLDDGYNNGQKNQSWVTITGNSWDAKGVWVRHYQWNGTSNAQGTARPYTTGTVFAQSSNTFPDGTGNPTNLIVTQSGSNIVLDWDAPVVSGYLVERYAISFTTGDLAGWGVATGNVGDANALNTEYTFAESYFDGFGVASGSTWKFRIRSDNDTYGKYSQYTSEVSIVIGTPPSTTTSSTTTTTTSTTVPYQPAPGPNDSGQSDSGGGGDGDSSPTGTTVPPEPDTEPEQESTVTTLPEETLPETEQPVATIPEESEPTETTLPPVEVEPTEPETAKVDNPSDNSTDLPEEFNNLPDDASAEEILKIITEVDFTGIPDDQFEAVLDKVFEDISDTEKVTEVLTSLLSEELDKEQLVSVMEAVFSEEASVEQVGAVVDDLLEADLSKEELAAVFNAVFDGDLSDEETIELAQEVLKGELDAEEFSTVIDAIFDEVVTDEVLIETFTVVLETELDAEKFEAIVNVLESEVISKEQVAEVVTLIIQQEGGVDAEQATELATSPKVLASIDGEQATEVFDAVVASEVSPEDGAAIVEAVQEAPTEVKEAFEEEINVFAGVFDDYVAIGSTIDVGSRRTVIVASLVTVAAVSIGLSAGGTSPAPNSSPTGGNPNNGNQFNARKEEESEAAGEIAWDGLEWIKYLSIYKYVNGEKVLDWKKFFKKFTYGIFGLGFTLAGSIVMYFTLSGFTQKVALWATAFAFLGAMWLHMQEPDSNE
jgi:hypothetical protein